MSSSAQIKPSTPYSRIGLYTVEMIEAGLPTEVISQFSATSGLSVAAVCAVVIPARTLKHRRAKSEALSCDESDKFARLVRIFDFAIEVFGDKEKALRWLSKPKKQFEDRTPLYLIQTDLGGRLVEQMIWRVADGMFA